MRGLVRMAWAGGLGCLLAGCLAPSMRTASGRPAPAVEGTDAKGQALRLADYRGRVVLLDFWKFG
jgi:hypothetical protein